MNMGMHPQTLRLLTLAALGIRQAREKRRTHPEAGAGRRPFWRWHCPLLPQFRLPASPRLLLCLLLLHVKALCPTAAVALMSGRSGAVSATWMGGGRRGAAAITVVRPPLW